MNYFVGIQKNGKPSLYQLNATNYIVQRTQVPETNTQFTAPLSAVVRSASNGSRRRVALICSASESNLLLALVRNHYISRLLVESAVVLNLSQNGKPDECTYFTRLPYRIPFSAINVCVCVIWVCLRKFQEMTWKIIFE